MIRAFLVAALLIVSTGAAAQDIALARFNNDIAALHLYRPSFPFWRHIFVVPDRFIVYGSAVNGRLLATMPDGGRRGEQGREDVARLLEASEGPVIHNQARGLFLLPNERRYGAFLEEWGEIYGRFGVPASIGLAQAIVESGLNGRVRSEARAIGFCQWLLGNWNRLKRLSPHVIEGYNQTTQAPYCAAYLSILATKYGSFIPALSEHHTGGTNVGRTLINGARLGGVDIREQYFLGAEFARDLRVVSPRTYSDIYGSYGPRSFYYAEMIFGNTANVARILETTPQTPVFAMRTPRALPLAEIMRRGSLTADEVRRFNPALTRSVPKGATVYLPIYVSQFGPDVSFWHRPPSRAYTALLNEFLALDVPIDRWDGEAFDTVLQDYRRRFQATRTEEGTVMATTLAYVLEDRRRSRQGPILAEFRTNARLLRLFQEARGEWDQFLLSSPPAPAVIVE